MRALLCLVACAACSSGSPDLPPLASGGQSASYCQAGQACTTGTYCYSGADGGCRYLGCPSGAWVCGPFDAGRRD